MDFADFLLMAYLLGTSMLIIYLTWLTSGMKDCMLVMEDKIRKLTDDIRHISLVSDRMSSTVSTLNLHKLEIADIERSIAKMRDEIKPEAPKKETPKPKY